MNVGGTSVSVATDRYTLQIRIIIKIPPIIHIPCTLFTHAYIYFKLYTIFIGVSGLWKNNEFYDATKHAIPRLVCELLGYVTYIGRAYH